MIKPHVFEALTEDIARTLDRQSLIDWLSWRDPSGTYRDKESLLKYGHFLSQENALYLVLNFLNNENYH
jgi:hypothetical protein